jgi:alkyl hydroperoxide reductase subunit AhpF
LQQKVAEKSNMTVTLNHEVKEFKGKTELTGVVIEDRATGEVKQWQYDSVFVFIGLAECRCGEGQGRD